MSIGNRNKLIIISSPSGAGKTTLCKLLIKKMKNINLSISYTSRSKRLNEIEGRDYYSEMKHYKEYKYVLVNENVQKTVSDIKKIIEYEQLIVEQNKILKEKLKKIINI